MPGAVVLGAAVTFAVEDGAGGAGLSLRGSGPASGRR